MTIRKNGIRAVASLLIVVFFLFTYPTPPIPKRSEPAPSSNGMVQGENPVWSSAARQAPLGSGKHTALLKSLAALLFVCAISIRYPLAPTSIRLSTLPSVAHARRRALLLPLQFSSRYV
ncbi:hypothetical protein [Gorillibacterium timonense]|uniref:hypothetical protein n=1 Tax=Gorillibacterium timonense TaxID=1689269 RepID=UPI00071E374F|nr:hypothetical protein [Gorillibacterium timonense]